MLLLGFNTLRSCLSREQMWELYESCYLLHNENWTMFDWLKALEQVAPPQGTHQKVMSAFAETCPKAIDRNYYYQNLNGYADDEFCVRTWYFGEEFTRWVVYTKALDLLAKLELTEEAKELARPIYSHLRRAVAINSVTEYNYFPNSDRDIFFDYLIPSKMKKRHVIIRNILTNLYELIYQLDNFNVFYFKRKNNPPGIQWDSEYEYSYYCNRLRYNYDVYQSPNVFKDSTYLARAFMTFPEPSILLSID